MLFELPNNTECTLTKFVGRTQKSGKDDVPAVSFRLKLTSVSNVMLDLFSKTMRFTVYAPVEGQEQLPGVEVTTPILRSKDLKHWAPENRLDGWSVIVARGIADGDALQMGSCKLDDFHFDFYEGGHMDVDFRVGTADLDEAGAGMLWGRQERKVFVAITAPEMPADAPPPIDGSREGGGPGFEERDATDLFAGEAGAGPDGDADADANGEPDGDDGEEEGDDTPPDDSSRVAWPFPKNADSSSQPPPQSVTIERSQPGTRTARGREKTKAALAAGAPQGCKYFNAHTGETWSGRGLMPKWLKVETAGGKQLSDFEVRA